MLTDKEKQEIERLQRHLAEHLRRLQQPPSVERVTDAQGDRIYVEHGGEQISIPIQSSQITRSLKIR